MKLRTKLVIAGAAGVAVVTIVAVRAVKRAARRVINRKMHKVLTEIVHMKGEDFIPGGSLGKSLFMRRVEKLDTKQLAFLCALIQVGYFIKVSEIDILHPTEAQIRRAVDKLRIEERLAPTNREDLLAALDTSDARDALISAFGVLANA